MSFDNYDKCSLLLPMNGANNGTTFTDWSPTTKTVTANGNAKTSTAQFKYYDSSGLFDGTGDYLTVPYTSAAFNIGSGDLTVCAWLRESDVSSQSILTIGSSSTDRQLSVFLDASGYLSSAFQSDSTTVSTFVSTSAPISLNTQTHIAVTKSGNSVRHFVDGVLIDTFTYSNTVQNSSPANIYIGRIPWATTYDYNGYMQDFAFFKGVALWTANFTPPTRLIGAISGTVYDKDGAVASRSIIAVPRSYPSKVYSTTSSAGDGTYSLTVPATELSVIGLANESVLREDKIERVIPE